MMTIINIIITIAIFIWAVVSLAWGIKAAYTAFAGKKDERMQMIVIKSMAQSFVAILVVHTVHLAIRLALGANFETWWGSFTDGIYMHPAAICLVFLGTFMFINERRFSSKEERYPIH